jgi:hypothetical protein
MLEKNEGQFTGFAFDCDNEYYTLNPQLLISMS